MPSAWLDVGRWEVVLKLLTMIMPLIDYIIGKVEQTGKTGEEKKAIAMLALKPVIAMAPEASPMVSAMVDSAVALKNETGEFNHRANEVIGA